MKVLIGILGCVQYARRGFHQAQRDTWLKDVPKFAGLEYRFFLGDGTATDDDEAAIQASVGGFDGNRGVDYGQKCRQAAIVSALESPYISDQADEVWLPCPDDYIHLTAKLRQIVRWALAHEFDYLFRCDTDTYAPLERLMDSGFDAYDLLGHPSLAEGAGYFLSHRTMQALADSPVATFADGTWVAQTLRARGITMQGDSRFSDEEVRQDNDLISTHVGFKVGYEPQRMYDLHARFTA